MCGSPRTRRSTNRQSSLWVYRHAAPMVFTSYFKREYDGYVARLLTSGVTGFAIALTVSRNCRKIKNRRCRSRSVTEIEPQLIASYTRERERERERKDVIFQNANRQASLCVFFSSAMNVKNVSRLSLCRTIHHKIPP